MNRLKGTIVRMESSETVSRVEIDVHGDVFVSVLLETPQSAAYLKTGQEVKLLFKETEVAIAKNLSGVISLSNRITARIKKIETSKVLSKLWLDYQGSEIISIISTRSVERLSLSVGDDIEWLVKANEISIAV